MLRLIALLLLLAATPAYATQSVVTQTTSSLASQWPSVWNNYLDSVLTLNSGTSRPSYAQTGTLWYETSGKKVYFYDGASDIPLTALDTANHFNVPPIGGGTATLSSSSTTDIGSVNPAYVLITGTTNISSFGSSMTPGAMKILVFQSALLLSYNATSLFIPGGTDLTVEAGSSALVLCTSSGNYRVVLYQKASNALPSIASNTALVNITGASAAPVGVSLSSWMDSTFGSTRGNIVYRGASSWQALSAGTAANVLTSGGPGQDPYWRPTVWPNGYGSSQRIHIQAYCYSLYLGGGSTGTLGFSFSTSFVSPPMVSLGDFYTCSGCAERIHTVSGVSTGGFTLYVNNTGSGGGTESSCFKILAFGN